MIISFKLIEVKIASELLNKTNNVNITRSLNFFRFFFTVTNGAFIKLPLNKKKENTEGMNNLL
jgi:hypothetical protein